MFEPFYTTKGSAEARGRACQVYGMARQSGGRRDIASQPGRGTEAAACFLPRSRSGRRSRGHGERTRRAPRRSPSTLLFGRRRPAVRQMTLMMPRTSAAGIERHRGGHARLHVPRSRAPRFDAVLFGHTSCPDRARPLARERSPHSAAYVPIVLATGYAELTDPSEGERGDLLFHPAQAIHAAPASADDCPRARRPRGRGQPGARRPDRNGERCRSARRAGIGEEFAESLHHRGGASSAR